MDLVHDGIGLLRVDEGLEEGVAHRRFLFVGEGVVGGAGRVDLGLACGGVFDVADSMDFIHGAVDLLGVDEGRDDLGGNLGLLRVGQGIVGGTGSIDLALAFGRVFDGADVADPGDGVVTEGDVDGLLERLHRLVDLGEGDVVVGVEGDGIGEGAAEDVGDGRIGGTDLGDVVTTLVHEGLERGAVDLLDDHVALTGDGRIDDVADGRGDLVVHGVGAHVLIGRGFVEVIDARGGAVFHGGAFGVGDGDRNGVEFAVVIGFVAGGDVDHVLRPLRIEGDAVLVLVPGFYAMAGFIDVLDTRGFGVVIAGEGITFADGEFREVGEIRVIRRFERTFEAFEADGVMLGRGDDFPEGGIADVYAFQDAHFI